MSAPRRRRCWLPTGGFTLVELLVVIGIIGLLVAALTPTLRLARSHTNVSTCLSNLRGQGQALLAYASENQGRMPPRILARDFATMSEFRLINAILAAYLGVPFPLDKDGIPVPTGIWRCPEVPPGMDQERWTHVGYLHYAPNRYLFDVVRYSPVTDTIAMFSGITAAWETPFRVQGWRQMDRVRRPSDVISFIDNVNYFDTSHNHREARQSVGLSCEIVYDPGGEACGDNRGSHEAVAARPALFLDGRAVALSNSPDYWQDQKVICQQRGGYLIEMFQREVTHFLWFVEPEHMLGLPTE